MADRPPNPIAFNPELMTVRQLKDVADYVHNLFDNILREDIVEGDLIYSIRSQREDWLKRWGNAR